MVKNSIMYLKIKKAQLVKNKFGQNDVFINMIGIYNDDDKFIKRVKLNEETLNALLSEKIQLSGLFYQELE